MIIIKYIFFGMYNNNNNNNREIISINDIVQQTKSIL